MLLGRGLCEELITRPEESYRLCCVVVCDLETSRMGAPYIYDISHLRVKEVIMRAANRPSNCSCDYRGFQMVQLIPNLDTRSDIIKWAMTDEGL